MEGKGTLSLLFIPSQEWVSAGRYARYLEILKRKVWCPSFPNTDSHAHYLLWLAGQHDAELPRNHTVGWIQLQSCCIFFPGRTVLLKGMHAPFLPLRGTDPPGLHGAMGLLGSATFSTKPRTVLDIPRKSVTLMVEITGQNVLASDLRGCIMEIKRGRSELQTIFELSTSQGLIWMEISLPSSLFSKLVASWGYG